MEIRRLSWGDRAALQQGFDYNFAEWPPRSPAVAVSDSLPVDEAWGGWVGDRLVAALVDYRLHQVVRGIVLPMAGLGGVWCYPEYRNRGYVRALIVRAFADMRDRGVAVSMLIPFRTGFYLKFGYVTAHANLEVRVPLAGLRAHLDLPEADCWQVERVPMKRERWPEVLAWLQAEIAPHAHGLVLPPIACTALWEAATGDRFGLFVRDHDRLEAVAFYRQESPSPIPGPARCLSATHVFWRSLAGRDRLLRFFASHRDRLATLALTTSWEVNPHHWCGDATDPPEIAFAGNPFMVRVLCVERAFQGLPVAMPGEIEIGVRDAQCPWNDGTFRLTAAAGTLQVERIGLSADGAAISCGIEGMAALLYGTLSLTEIEHCGWVGYAEGDRADTERRRRLLQAWFPPRPLYNPFRF